MKGLIANFVQAVVAGISMAVGHLGTNKIKISSHKEMENSRSLIPPSFTARPIEASRASPAFLSLPFSIHNCFFPVPYPSTAEFKVEAMKFWI